MIGSLLSEQGIVSGKNIMFVDEFETLQLMVATGFGISFVPKSTLNSIDESVRTISLPGSTGWLYHHLIWEGSALNDRIANEAALYMRQHKHLD
jgi:DNA-binding transcriptional LysR family regulator